MAGDFWDIEGMRRGECSIHLFVFENQAGRYWKYLMHHIHRTRVSLIDRDTCEDCREDEVTGDG
jgi:hypothetical protein